MERAGLALTLTAILLAGCLQGGDGDTDDPEDPVGTDGLGFGARSGLPTEPGNRNLTHAPLWAVGEWWTYRLQAPPFNEDAETTIVVAGADEEHYYVAQPLQDVQILPYIMHIPGIGEVSRDDLSYDAHDEPWKLLDFPLEQGHRWQGIYWGGAPMELEVTAVQGDVARITLTREGASAQIAYDAQVGNLIAYEETNEDGVIMIKLELQEHGHGYTGDLQLAYGQDLLICHGAALGAIEVKNCATGDPSTPDGSFEIPEGYDEATYALVINPGLVSDQSAPGSYRIRVTDPDGSYQELTTHSLGGGGAMLFENKTDPAGNWEYEAVAGGAGFAIVEGIVHQRLDIRLPEGCVLSAETDTDPERDLVVC